MTDVTLPAPGVRRILAAEGIMADKIYTEQDLHDAFICGIKHATNHEQGQPEPQVENWIDCLFYEGFQNQQLFNKRRPAKAGK